MYPMAMGYFERHYRAGNLGRSPSGVFQPLVRGPQKLVISAHIPPLSHSFVITRPSLLPLTSPIHSKLLFRLCKVKE